MAKETKSTYAYSPLSAHPDSIRLLRLLPASQVRDPIQSQIFNYSLANPTRTSHLYECLSYVWGDIEDKPTISVDGADLAVTKNLHGALQRLRDPHLDRILWVDALCINQDDLEERTQQVQMMALIYAYASRVVVWLGEEAGGSGDAMELLRKEAGRIYREKRNLHDTEVEKYAPDRSVVAVDSPEDGFLREKALDLLKRPWFRRIWVLQEIAAARVVLVMCGSEEFTGACFYWALSAVLEWCQDADLRGMISSILYLLGDASVLRLDSPKVGESFRLGICPLSQLIDMFRLREATDRRDKVYALLGVISSDSDGSEIVPDYSRESDLLYQDLVQSILGRKVKTSWVSKNGCDHGRITGKGCTVGYISNVNTTKSDRQIVSITPTYHCSPLVHQQSSKMELIWTLHNSATAVEDGDVVCWLEGSTMPTIIRSHENFFAVVVILAKLPRTLAETIFHKGLEVVHRSSHNDDSGQRPVPAQYNRDFDLVWVFDSNWTANGLHHGQQSRKETTLARLSSMAQVLEDVNDTDGLRSLVERGSGIIRESEVASNQVVERFRDLHQVVPNWDLYLHLKRDLQHAFCGDGFTAGLPNEIELDVAEVRARLLSTAENGTELLGFLLNEVSVLFASIDGRETFYDQDQGLKLAFLFDVWGRAINPYSMIGLVQHVERHSLNQRVTLGHFPSPLYMDIVEVLVQATTQHPGWGESLIGMLVEFAKDNVDRMYCLLRALIVCSTAPPDWKQAVIDGVLTTHYEEFSEAILDKAAWTSLNLEGRYRAIVDFLWHHYVLQAKDFVGISANGTFQLRRQHMEKFFNDYRFWQACYDGRADDIWNDIVESGRVDPYMLVMCKDLRGRWCRVAAFQAAAMNGHVECCKVLLERGFGNRITPALWSEICEHGGIANTKVEQITELLSSHYPANWQVPVSLKDVGEIQIQKSSKSETW